MLTAGLLASILLAPAHHPPANVDDFNDIADRAADLADGVVASPADLLRNDAPEQHPFVSPVASDDDLGWVDTYFPYILDDDLHPDIDKNIIPIWLLTAFFGPFLGPLWIPKLITKLTPDDSYQSEALAIWLFHSLIYLLTFTGYAASVPIVGWALVAVMYGIVIANAVYLFPVATINSFNRHVSGGGGGGDGGGGSKKKKRRKKAPVKKKKAAGLYAPGNEVRPAAIGLGTAGLAY